MFVSDRRLMKNSDELYDENDYFLYTSQPFALQRITPDASSTS